MLSKTIVKYIQSLSHKKVRDEEGVFIAEGPKVVAEFLSSNLLKCKNIYALKSWIDEQQTDFKNIPDEEISDIELGKISLLKTPNKVLAVFYKKQQPSVEIQNKISLMLDDIQDPGNLGTIIRTADWFGVKNIICSNDCVDCYNPKVVQASMGSLARVNIIYQDLPEFINKNKNIKVYAAALNGKNIFSYEKIKQGIILIGNESKGISEDLIDQATEKITIPKQGRAESLNAAVACGIILSHLV